MAQLSYWHDEQNVANGQTDTDRQHLSAYIRYKILCRYTINVKTYMAYNCYDLVGSPTYVHSFPEIKLLYVIATVYAKQKHLQCKKGEANQKQQLSDCTCD